MKKTIVASICVAAHLAFAPAGAALDRYLGEILMMSYDFCPQGTLPTDGRLMSVAQNTALFSLLGAKYGGDGRSTFMLPDMRGRSPLATGSAVPMFTSGGPGYRPYEVGDRGGVETLDVTSGDRSLNIMNPYLTVTFCIATEGMFPSRP